MANAVMDYLRTHKPAGFEAKPYYSRAGDFLTCVFEDRDHYAERIDDYLTLLLSMDNNEVVGMKLKGVSHLYNLIGEYNWRVIDGDGNIMLSLFVMAGMAATPDNGSIPAYRRVLEGSANVSVPVEPLLAA